MRELPTSSCHVATLPSETTVHTSPTENLRQNIFIAYKTVGAHTVSEKRFFCPPDRQTVNVRQWLHGGT